MASFEELIESLGKLNDSSPGRFEIVLDDFNQNGSAAIKKAIDKVLEMSKEDKEGGPYHAICLAAFENPTGEITSQVKRETPLMQVIARIPKLHAGLPKPYLSGPRGLGCDAYVKAAILMHPVFLAEVGNNTSLPEPGNIVKVDLGANSTKYGEYLGIVSSTSVASPGEDVPASKAFNDAETPQGTTDDIVQSIQASLDRVAGMIQ